MKKKKKIIKPFSKLKKRISLMEFKKQQTQVTAFSILSMKLIFADTSNWQNTKIIKNEEKGEIKQKNKIKRQWCYYCVVSCNNKELLFFNKGELILRLPTPTLMLAIASGFFLDDPTSTWAWCGLIGSGWDGCIYGLRQNLETLELQFVSKLQFEYPITILSVLTPSTSSTSTSTSTATIERNSYLLCAGHWNGWRCYHLPTGKLICDVEENGWVTMMSVGDVDSDGYDEVGIYANQVLSIYKLNQS